MSLVQSFVRAAAGLFTAAALFGASTAALGKEALPEADRAAVALLNPLTTSPVPLDTATMPTTGVVAAVPHASFASLADAVAAQDGLVDDEHLRCLASAVYFESQGEPLAGQLAVAQVILNRTRSGRFAADVCGVLTQRGQFGFVRGGTIPTVAQGRPAWRTAIAVAKVALAEAWDQTAPQALYFHGLREGRVGGHRVAVIGHHAFYR